MNTYRTFTMYGEIKEQQAIDSKYLYNISKWEIRSEYKWRNPNFKNYRDQTIVCINIDTGKVVWVMYLGKDGTFKVYSRKDINREVVDTVVKTMCCLGEWTEGFIREVMAV